MVAGKEVTPGDVSATARLKRYWTTGPGREKWIHSPTPFRTLRALLSKYVHDPAELDGLTANIYHAATGRWPGKGNGGPV